MNATRASEPQDRRDGAVFRGRLLQALEDGAAELRVEAGGADVELAAAGGLTGLVPEEDADDRLPGLGALLRGRSPDALGLTGIQVADDHLQRMRWGELDLAVGIWTAPTGRKRLPPAAAEALRERACSRTFVFPGSGVDGHLADPKRGWARLPERSRLEDLRIHDLRRSLGSWQAMTGASLAIIGKSLNHKTVQATAVYARLNIDPVRQSVQAAVDAIFERASEKPSGDIVELKSRKGA